jgi:hypothetical protein
MQSATEAAGHDTSSEAVLELEPEPEPLLEPAAAAADGVDTYDRYCRHALWGRRCRWGAKCFYAHDVPEPVLARYRARVSAGQRSRSNMMGRRVVLSFMHLPAALWRLYISSVIFYRKYTGLTAARANDFTAHLG